MGINVLTCVLAGHACVNLRHGLRCRIRLIKLLRRYFMKIRRKKIIRVKRTMRVR